MKRYLLILGSLAFILGACTDGAGEDQEPVGSNNGGGDDGGAEEETDNGETVDAGEGLEIYEANCMSCHGDDMGGASGPPLEGFSEDEVRTAIEEGPGAMPADLVTGEEAESVANYVANEG